jgi:hypothetical protein
VQYCCVVEQCPSTFSSARHRKRHLLRHHKLPMAFVNGSTPPPKPSQTVQSISVPQGAGSREPCYFFNTKSGCKKGSACTFRHDLVDTVSVTQLRNRLFSGTRGRGITQRRSTPTLDNAHDDLQDVSASDDIDMLADGVSAISVRVPSKIGFGKRR